MLVLSLSVSSCCSRLDMTRMASSTGALVNRLTTSKLTMTSVSARSIWRIRCTKSAEFLTCKGPWPASGERILVNSFASRCDGDPMADPMAATIYWRRRVLEALHIHQQHQTSNLDCGLNINATWLPLLGKPPSSK